jgi:hypothetical protein
LILQNRFNAIAVELLHGSAQALLSNVDAKVSCMNGKDGDSSKQDSQYRPLAVLTHALAVLTHSPVGFPSLFPFLAASKMLEALRMLRRFTSYFTQIICPGTLP